MSHGKPQMDNPRHPRPERAGERSPLFRMGALWMMGSSGLFAGSFVPAGEGGVVTPGSPGAADGAAPATCASDSFAPWLWCYR